MKCLLDTQALIWAIANEKKLSRRAHEILSDVETIRYVSAVSFFEMSIKISIGKLDIRGIPYDELPAILYGRQFEQIVLDPFDSVALHRLPLKENHRDPFDRMLISQAIARNLTLISADEKIALYREDGLSLIW